MGSKVKVLGLLALITFVHSLSASVPYSTSTSRTYAQYSSLAYCPAKCIESWSCQSGMGSTLINLTYIFGNTNAAVFVGYQPDQNQIVAAFKGSISFDIWFIESERTTVKYP